MSHKEIFAGGGDVWRNEHRNCYTGGALKEKPEPTASQRNSVDSRLSHISDPDKTDLKLHFLPVHQTRDYWRLLSPLQPSIEITCASFSHLAIVYVIRVTPVTVWIGVNLPGERCVSGVINHLCLVVVLPVCFTWLLSLLFQSLSDQDVNLDRFNGASLEPHMQIDCMKRKRVWISHNYLVGFLEYSATFGLRASLVITAQEMCELYVLS